MCFFLLRIKRTYNFAKFVKKMSSQKRKKNHDYMLYCIAVPSASTLTLPLNTQAPQQRAEEAVVANTGAVVSNLNKVLASIHELRKGYSGPAEAKYVTPDDLEISIGGKSKEPVKTGEQITSATSPTGDINDVKGRFGKIILLNLFQLCY